MAKRKSDVEKKKSKPAFVSVYEQTGDIIDKPKNKGGRPSKYSAELAAKICRKVATTPLGLDHICASNDEFPCSDTVYQWLIDYPEFSEKYAQAKRNQAEVLVNEMISIAYDSSRDVIDKEDGSMGFNSEFVARSRLKIDTIKWMACKLLPKVYGDKIQNETVVTISHEKAVEALG